MRKFSKIKYERTKFVAKSCEQTHDYMRCDECHLFRNLFSIYVDKFTIYLCHISYQQIPKSAESTNCLLA